MIVTKPASSDYSNLEANLRRGANTVEITAEDERRRKTRQGGPACGSVVGFGVFCFQCYVVWYLSIVQPPFVVSAIGPLILLGHLFWCIHSCVLGWCGSFLHFMISEARSWMRVHLKSEWYWQNSWIESENPQMEIWKAQLTTSRTPEVCRWNASPHWLLWSSRMN